MGEGEQARSRATGLLIAPRSSEEIPAVGALVRHHRAKGDLRLGAADSPRELARGLRSGAYAALILGVAPGSDAALEALERLRAEGVTTPCALLIRRGDTRSRARAEPLAGCARFEIESLAPATLAAWWQGVRAAQAVDALDAPLWQWRTDAFGAFTHLSPAWLAFSGRALDAERGRGWFDGVHPDDRADFEKVFATELAGQREWTCDARHRAAGGAYRWLRHHGTPCSRGGRFAGYAGISHDISDLRAVQSELQALVARLAQANRELEELVAAAAHDLQEPLRNAQALLGEARRAAVQETDALLDAAADQTRRASARAAELVEFARLGQVPCSPQRVDAGECVQWALANLRERIEATRAELRLEPLPEVFADPLLLGRVFQNLLANALAFAGDAPPQVCVAGEVHGAVCELRVSDRGVGIAPEHHETIFAAFQRLGTDDAPGSGLGLAICRKLLARQGGGIRVDSQPGRGATFTLELPAAPERAAARPAPPGGV